MEDGAKTIAIILIASLVLGLLVIALHPSYRRAAEAMLQGDPGQSPLWISNAHYYPDVDIERKGEPDDPE